MADLILEREGFWTKTDKPMPHYLTKKERSNTEIFVKAMMRVEAKAQGKKYKSSHRCIFCGEKVGNIEYFLDGWMWPEGYSHYVQKHGITPSKAFTFFIKERSKS